MEKCKAIEAKIELFKTLFEKLILLAIALGGGLGTLLIKYPQRVSLLIFTAFLLDLVLISIVVTIRVWYKEVEN